MKRQEFAYTANSMISIPEIEWFRLQSNAKAVPLRGNAHTLAVMVDELCVGWILKENVPESK